METGIRMSEEVHDEAPYLPLQDYDAIKYDDSRLSQLGYKQELNRNLSAISNFSVTFSIISVLTGLTTTFTTGLTFGGTVTMIYGWPIAGFFTFIVGLSMAEICSSFPTSGGLYYWSAKLSGNNWGPFASWLTGWAVVFFYGDGRSNPLLSSANLGFYYIRGMYVDKREKAKDVEWTIEIEET